MLAERADAPRCLVGQRAEILSRPAEVDHLLNRRRQGQPAEVVAIAVKAQHRLQKRFWHLKETKHTNKAVVAVARELCAFIWETLWAVSREV